MVLTAGDGIVSVAGRLESLSSPPVERGGVWYVPTDFIGRALPLISDQPVELRSRSGLVIVGDVRVPQVVGRYQRTGRRSRLRLVVTPSIEPRIERAAGRLLVTFDADAVDLVMRDFAPDDLLRRVVVDDRRARLEAELGNAFGSFAADSSPALGGSLEVVIDIGPAAEARAAPPPAPDPRPAVVTEAGIEEEDAELPALADSRGAVDGQRHRHRCGTRRRRRGDPRPRGHAGEGRHPPAWPGGCRPPSSGGSGCASC